MNDYIPQRASRAIRCTGPFVFVHISCMPRYIFFLLLSLPDSDISIDPPDWHTTWSRMPPRCSHCEHVASCNVSSSTVIHYADGPWEGVASLFFFFSDSQLFSDLTLVVVIVCVQMQFSHSRSQCFTSCDYAVTPCAWFSCPCASMLHSIRSVRTEQQLHMVTHSLTLALSLTRLRFA